MEERIKRIETQINILRELHNHYSCDVELLKTKVDDNIWGNKFSKFLRNLDYILTSIILIRIIFILF